MVEIPRVIRWSLAPCGGQKYEVYVILRRVAVGLTVKRLTPHLHVVRVWITVRILALVRLWVKLRFNEVWTRIWTDRLR